MGGGVPTAVLACRDKCIRFMKVGCALLVLHHFIHSFIPWSSFILFDITVVGCLLRAKSAHMLLPLMVQSLSVGHFITRCGVFALTCALFMVSAAKSWSGTPPNLSWNVVKRGKPIVWSSASDLSHTVASFFFQNMVDKLFTEPTMEWSQSFSWTKSGVSVVVCFFCGALTASVVSYNNSV